MCVLCCVDEAESRIACLVDVFVALEADGGARADRNGQAQDLESDDERGQAEQRRQVVVHVVDDGRIAAGLIVGGRVGLRFARLTRRLECGVGVVVRAVAAAALEQRLNGAHDAEGHLVAVRVDQLDGLVEAGL